MSAFKSRTRKQLQTQVQEVPSKLGVKASRFWTLIARYEIETAGQAIFMGI